MAVLMGRKHERVDYTNVIVQATIPILFTLIIVSGAVHGS